MRKPFRFFFDDSDGAAIDDTSPISVDDLPPEHLFPLGICVRYHRKGSSTPQIRPLGRCRMRFLADDDADGDLPTSDEVAPENYDLWKTKGRLFLEFYTRESQKILTIGTKLLVEPTIKMWFWPVRITSAFLFTSLTTAGYICRDRDVVGMLKCEPDREEWRKEVIAGFLGGKKYVPSIEMDRSDPALDVAVRAPMPEVWSASAEQELYICAASYGPPQDGLDKEWDPHLMDDEEREAARNDPRSVPNGAIPARLVYQCLKESLVDVSDPTIRSIRDLVFGSAVPFTPLRFTRTWLPKPNRSIHFPRQKVVFRDVEGTRLHEQDFSLPPHGVLWVPNVTFKTFPIGTTLELDGDMRWLPFTTDVWLMKGERIPLKVTIPASTNPQHIILRLPMSRAMLEDRTRPSAGQYAGGACTYFSLRRAVRAWIDNRITGGRLNNGVKLTSQPTLDLLGQAFDGTGITPHSVANDQPAPDMDPELGGGQLLRLMKVLFPLTTNQYAIPDGVAPDPHPTEYTQGEAAYWLWQSAFDGEADPPRYRKLKDPKVVCNYGDDHMGRGAAGAIVLLGLGRYHSETHVAPPARAGADYIDDNVQNMCDGLEPGALLRIVWAGDMDLYRELIDRGEPTEPSVAVHGHSPVFLEYGRNDAGTVTSLRVIDDSPDRDKKYSEYTVDGRAPNRRIGPADVWVAANWTE